MDFFDQPAYSLTKRLTSVVGVWPYQSKRTRYYKNAIMFFGFFSVLYPVVAKLFFVVGVDNETAIQCLPQMMTLIGILVKYLNGVLHTEKIREVFDRIKSDSERLMNLPEYEVLHMYAMQGRSFLLYFLSALIMLVVVYFALPTTLYIKDLVTNVTEDRYRMYAMTYIFVDDDDVYTFMAIHSYFASVLVPYVLYSLDSIYIIFTQHACTMFAIVGYRLKTIHVLNPAALKKEFDPRKYEKLLCDDQERMYEKLRMCVKEHQRALECAAIVQSAFSTALFLQIAINIILLSITGVQALLKLAERSFINVAMMITWLLGDYLHLFFLYLPGQRLLNYSTQIYFDALDCHWVKCVKKSRVIYQILVMRSLYPFKLTALKVTPLNMAAFLSVTQAAVSYFTVFSSTM